MMTDEETVWVELNYSLGPRAANTAFRRILDERNRLRADNYHQNQKAKVIIDLKGQLTVERQEVERLQSAREDALRERLNELKACADEIKRLRERVDQEENLRKEAEAKVEQLQDGLQYVAENASGGDVPDSWPVWAADYLHKMEG